MQGVGGVSMREVGVGLLEVAHGEADSTSDSAPLPPLLPIHQ